MPNRQWAEVTLLHLREKVFRVHGAELAEWGWTPRRAVAFREALLASAIENHYLERVWTGFSYRYKFDVDLPTPHGVPMRSWVIWEIGEGDDIPTLVTVYPR